MRANAVWWRNTVPAFVQDYSDKWVKADDTAGFPVIDLVDLAGDRLEKRLADREGGVVGHPDDVRRRPARDGPVEG